MPGNVQKAMRHTKDGLGPKAPHSQRTWDFRSRMGES